jgi:hypothetical protein
MGYTFGPKGFSRGCKVFSSRSNKETESDVVITSDSRSGGEGEVTEITDLREIVARTIQLSALQ